MLVIRNGGNELFSMNGQVKGSRWLVNPNIGYELFCMRRHDPTFPCYVRAPDRTFWEAAGFYDPTTDNTAKVNDRVGVDDRHGC